MPLTPPQQWRARAIDMNKNELSCGIPPQVSVLIISHTLNINPLSEKIPWEIGELMKLEVLQLFSNELNGSISDEIGNLKLLHRLSFFNNNLIGSITSTLGNLTDLVILFLHNNQFSGQWPEKGFSIISLSVIALTSNKFEGLLPLPSRSTSYYSIRTNNIEGEISSLICNATNLSFILLSNNSLIGSLLECL
ncbi:hypothetical protein EUGRSUZ_H02329 [Eucalyptus grandis]|uniref:Uncharacterized protein n=2 Tax=Eucalyptus grandis TaxID=71139 RepID=A0ACC3JQN6_EUCGR|nr:hypothetical protein EUGRSUZ_H02329 [Eucalyptus grandis]